MKKKCKKCGSSTNHGFSRTHWRLNRGCYQLGLCGECDYKTGELACPCYVDYCTDCLLSFWYLKGVSSPLERERKKRQTEREIMITDKFPPEGYLTAGEVATKLGEKIEVIYSLLKTGEIRAKKVDGGENNGKWLVVKTDLDDYCRVKAQVTFATLTLPLVPVRLHGIMGGEGGWQWILEKCPYCGKRHATAGAE